jgi:hypothetical protein
MKESTIRDFFLGTASAAALASPSPAPSEKPCSRNIAIDDLDSRFEVTRPMAAMLCDARMAGKISPHQLAIVARSLFGSRHFAWEDPMLTEIMGGWSEIDGSKTISAAELGEERNRLLGLGSGS